MSGRPLLCRLRAHRACPPDIVRAPRGWYPTSREGTTMPVDFIGMISHRLASEIIPPRGPIFDADFIRDFAQAHERGGFDRILIGYYSNAPDGFLVAAHAAASTERLG